MGNGNALALAQICRKLDGTPLALELSAFRTNSFGSKRGWDNHVALFWSNRRTAPHHQTLRSMMEWSHALLNETEQRILRRLAVFEKPFSLDAARLVAVDDDVDLLRIADVVDSLVAKSLPIPDDHGRGSLLLSPSRSSGELRRPAGSKS